jgi:hypothetical protein
MQQPATRLRCDPTDYAKRQQEKKERAKELREQRQRGVFSDDHTFTPKYVSRYGRLHLCVISYLVIYPRSAPPKE